MKKSSSIFLFVFVVTFPFIAYAAVTESNSYLDILKEIVQRNNTNAPVVAPTAQQTQTKYCYGNKIPVTTTCTSDMNPYSNSTAPVTSPQSTPQTQSPLASLLQALNFGSGGEASSPSDSSSSNSGNQGTLQRYASLGQQFIQQPEAPKSDPQAPTPSSTANGDGQDAGYGLKYTGNATPGKCPNDTGVQWLAKIPEGQVKVFSDGNNEGGGASQRRLCGNNIKDANPKLKKAFLDACKVIGKPIVASEIVRKNIPWVAADEATKKAGFIKGQNCNTDTGGVGHADGNAADVYFAGLTDTEREAVLLQFKNNGVMLNGCYAKNNYVHLAVGKGSYNQKGPCTGNLAKDLRMMGFR